MGFRCEWHSNRQGLRPPKSTSEAPTSLLQPSLYAQCTPHNCGTCAGHVCYSWGLLVSNDGMNGPCSTGLPNPHRVMGRYAPHRPKPVAFEEQAVLIQWAQCLRWPICKAWLLLAHGVFDSARGPPWMPSASDSRINRSIFVPSRAFHHTRLSAIRRKTCLEQCGPCGDHDVGGQASSPRYSCLRAAAPTQSASGCGIAQSVHSMWAAFLRRWSDSIGFRFGTE